MMNTKMALTKRPEVNDRLMFTMFMITFENLGCPDDILDPISNRVRIATTSVRI